jgi:chromosome segregation ATPase
MLTFFNIGKANAEITRLNAELKKTQDERDAAQSNSSAIATEAERLKADNISKADAIANHATILAAKDAEIAGLKTELTAAKAVVTDFDAKVEKSASTKALEICAAQGISPVKGGKPSDTPAKPKEATEGLTGMARIRASIQQQFANGTLQAVK